MSNVTDIIYNNLPFYLDSADYARLDTLLTPQGMAQQMENNIHALMMPTSIVTKDFILKDPLGIALPKLQYLNEMKMGGEYSLTDNHIFTSDGHLLLFISPRYPANKTAENAELIDEIEKLADQHSTPEVKIEYFGGPAISVYNARQIRTDMTLTMGAALLVITVVILLSFRNKMSIFFILLPVLFGGLFALCCLYFIRGELSIIAVGAGSAILGVVLSYSIHVVTHHEHVSDTQQLISEMWQPLTIGSFTTIGAFFSLTFTSSAVLQDFGWFASLSIIGATFFCLVFLPHLLHIGSVVPADKDTTHTGRSRLLSLIDRFSHIDLSRSKALIALILVTSIAGFFLSERVGFTSDLNDLSYSPPRFTHARQVLDSAFNQDGNAIYFVATGSNEDEALKKYEQMTAGLDTLKAEGKINGFNSARFLAVNKTEQKKKIDQWNSYFSPGKKEKLLSLATTEGHKKGFESSFFAPLNDILTRQYSTVDFATQPALGDFVTNEGGTSMAISRVMLTQEQKQAAYDHFAKDNNVVILDKPHFLSQFVDATTADFNFVLIVSSIIVFIALLVSYGRIELAVLSFMPMALSWFIIMGVMAVLGLKLNVVSIIISTFIFGTGDDFSIFITDGLLSEYRTGKKLLAEHKTAIFFSAFTTIVGMGALFFAKHPSLLSVAQTSVIGMVAVVLIAYTIQPAIWRFFVTSRTDVGRAPWTIMRVIACALYMGGFIVQSLLIILLLPAIWLVPVKTAKKREWVSKLTSGACKNILRHSFAQLEYNINYTPDKPVIYIANHQSIVDLLQAVATLPKTIILVKGYIWNNPITGPIVRALGYAPIDWGHEAITEVLKKRIEEGYSILVFPEGTRSADGNIGRFHKGAFYLAQQLGLDIVPVVLCGNNLACQKGDTFFYKPSILSLTVYPPAKDGENEWGTNYKEKRTAAEHWYRQEYAQVSERLTRSSNPYYANMLVQNYIYKGPVLEWYTRVKVALEDNYNVFDQLLPRQASIVDIGCGVGYIDYMLSFLSHGQREITGIDYDQEKIDIAKHCFSLRNEPGLNFIYANAHDTSLPHADAFLLLDMLHYMPHSEQQKLIKQCMDKLNEGGMIVIRDGNRDNEEGQKATSLTEILSTKVFRWNKTEGDLHFISFEKMETFAHQMGYTTTRQRNDQTTSNEIMVMKRK